jgi:glyoxylase-like metal-dependent hydrolase (beta-lactamase superfamily II)
MVNCYVALCTETAEAVVIDPGDEAPLVLDLIEKEGLTLKQILLTHCHADHVGGVKVLAESTGAPVKIHKADHFLLDGAVDHGRLFGLEIDKPPAPDGYLAEGDTVQFGREVLNVLHTPGHSPGGICFLADGQVFVGDTLFAGSIGRFDLPGGSYEQLIGSITAKILSLDEDIVVYPGHGPSTTVGQEKTTNPFFV